MLFIIDNYDSFVYNLARYVSELGFKPTIIRNDAITVKALALLKPTHIIISPGPCAPKQAGISLEVVSTFGKIIPILGVCLGHQAIGEAYGGVITKALKPMHGIASFITHNKKGLFKDVQNPLMVGRYHSLIVNKKHLPSDLIVTAYSEEGEIMAIQHKKHPVYGVQFHPESILTESGYTLLDNFLNSPL